MPSKTTPTATKTTAAKPRARKPIPDIDTSGTTSAVDALAAPAQTGGAVQVDQVVHVPPTQLLIGPNVRKTTDPAAYKMLVDSISELGVLEAVTAFVNDAGDLEVVTGQTRTNAAVEVGVPTIPVRIIARPESLAMTQLVENTARASMTRADQVAAIQQLAFDFKVPAAKIAKRAGMNKQGVEHAIKIAEAPVALAGLDNERMPLDVLAAIADSGLTEEEAKPIFESQYNPTRELENAIRAKERRAKVAAKVAELQSEGKRTTTDRPEDEYGQRLKNSPAAWLTDLAGEVTVDTHADCPGHALWVGFQRSWDPEISVIPLCTEYAAHHKLRGAPAKSAATDAEKAEKALKTRLNKAWSDVTAIRLAWIRDNLLPAKKLPTGWQRFVIDDFMDEHDHTGASLSFGGAAVREVNRILGLGVEEQISEYTGTAWADREKVAELFGVEFAKRPDHAIFALAIARHESAMVPRGGWERLSPRYMALLTDNGYQLTEEEQLVLDRLAKIHARRTDALAPVGDELEEVA